MHIAPAIVDDATARAAATQVLLGIDFGTAYTKAVWRDYGGRRSGVAAVGTDGASMAESVVWLDRMGGLHLADPGGARAERFLKMRLAERGLGSGDRTDIAAMSVFFVGSMLRTANTATKAELRGAPFGLYGAALGCPAEYCDDGRIAVFQRVAAQAWRWAHDPLAPTCLADIRAWMRIPADKEAYDLFEARAEVAAAVDAFAMRRDTPEGRYAFLDIGAGTLDGACFKIFREPEKTGITVLATAVAELGVEKVARMASGAADADARKHELFSAHSFSAECWTQPRLAVSSFVGALLNQARQHDRRADWLTPEGGRRGVWTLAADLASVATHLPVYFGGGGMTSRFYREATDRADNTNLTSQYGLPRLRLADLPAPEGFRPVRDAPFHRMAVAFGLTRPSSETPVLTLPSRLRDSLQPAVSPRPRRTSAIDYFDSKDAYD